MSKLKSLFGGDAASEAVNQAIEDSGDIFEEAERLYSEADAESTVWSETYDLSNQIRVIFVFPGFDGDPVEITIEEPLKMHISEGDPNWYVEDADGSGYIVHPDGLVIELHPREGESPFAS